MNDNEHTVWKCMICGLTNSIHAPKCQACFSLSTIKPKRIRLNMVIIGGYFRSNENNKTKIPNEIRAIIINYIEKKIIYAVGRNAYDQFGCTIPTVNKYVFHRLLDLESLVNDVNDIYNNDCALIIKSSINKIYTAGYNTCSQLGLPAIKTIKTWTRIDIDNVDFISTGICNSYNTFIYTLDNKLYANGKNEYNVFGSDTTVKLFEMDTAWLNDGEKINNISCGSKHFMFSTINLNIYAFGDNSCNQCIKDTKQQNIIMPILVDSNITSVACGDWSTCVLTKEGIAKLSGDVKQIVYFDNKIIYFDDKHFISKIKCGARHCLLLDNKGVVYSLGYAEYGQRGFNPKTQNVSQNELYTINTDNHKIVDIECGGDHSILLSNDNQLLCFGFNGFKQCSTVVKDMYIFSPILFNKTMELGDDYVVEKVICLHNETLIIINPFAT